MPFDDEELQYSLSSKQDVNDVEPNKNI